MTHENLKRVRATRKFRGVSFHAQLIRAALEEWRSLLGRDEEGNLEAQSHNLVYDRGPESWHPDSVDEWFGEYGTLPHNEYAHLEVSAYASGHSFRVIRYSSHTEVTVSAGTKGEVQRVLNVFVEAEESSRLPEASTYDPPRPVVFVGHGHSGDWQKIKDHLHDQHGYQVEAYEVGARAGHGIRDVLGSMLDASSFALLVMTAEDEVKDTGGEGEEWRARQNVVHEAGLFQGRLGFHRAIAVVESGVEVFSNLDGVNQIRYDSGHVESTFGHILATLRREFGDRR